MTSVEGVPACLLASVPVVQPPHLEGDPSLATEILPGPPSLTSIQQGASRKDHKKSAPAFSYLPVSDPGTTYGGHMISPLATAPNEVDGPRRKRARLDKSAATSRAQRASARNLSVPVAPEAPLPTESLASTSQVIPEIDTLAAGVESDDAVMSRSGSAVPVEETASITHNKRARKDKGKERDNGVRVKEEPSAVALSSFEPSPALPNEDHCSACRSFGSLVYCDGCPRAYHLWCLNPPMEASELPEGESRWFCPACIRRQHPPSKPPASLKFMAPLVAQAQTILPTEYQVPQDIRTVFKDVATGGRGTFVDSSEIKPPRLNRHGQLEDREPYRLKDRNGEPVLCFRCGKSALPPDVAAEAPAAKRARRSTSVLPNNTERMGRMIISCDYCHLHWHLDCLDPPLPCMPPWGKKWMCPNHVEQILKPKKRIPRQAQPIEVTKPGQWNNGNIEVIRPEISPIIPTKVAVDEVLINGRRYRVPERVITMDFWNKAKGYDKGKEKEVQPEPDEAMSSALSSPLTELSSLPEIEESPSPVAPQIGLFDVEELKAALFLCALNRQPSTSEPRQDTPSDVQDENITMEGIGETKATAPLKASDTNVNGKLKDVPRRQSRTSPAHATKAASLKIPGIPSTSQAKAHESISKLKRSTAAERSEETIQDTQLSVPVPALRESRPRADHKDAFPASLSMPPPNGVDATESISSAPQPTAPSVDESSGRTSARPKRTRQPPRRTPVPVAGTRSSSRLNGAGSDTVVGSQQQSVESAEERISRPSSSQTSQLSSERRGRGRPPKHPKPVTPAPALDKSMAAPVTPSASAKAESGTATTPSLKIRLPRLGSLNQHSNNTVNPASDIEMADASAPAVPRPRGRPRKVVVGGRGHQRSHPRQASSSRTSMTDVTLPAAEAVL